MSAATMYGDAPRRGRGLGFVAGAIATLLLHGGVIAVVFISRAADSATPPLLAGQVVDVQAVKFGKPRDLSFLPHKQLVVKSHGPKQVNLTQNEHALPKPPDEKKLPEIDDKNALPAPPSDDDEQKGAEDTGDEKGLKGGTATQGKGPIYYQHLQAAVQNAWTVPTTIADDKLAKLKAMACIKIDPDGKIVDVGLKQKSGDDDFDATLLRALQSIDKFEPPTPDVKDVVTSDGVCMIFQKSR